jgi:adenosylmethionine-8-amino-7-oxononanoate aminotransferase
MSSAAWIEKDLTYNWHPYTQMRSLREAPPVLIERAEGIRLYDADGNWYYDTIASWWCNVHGHGHPRLREALARQFAELDHVLFGAIAHKPAIALAERLVKLTPEGLTRVFYSDNGSTAVEVALKMSMQYWRNLGRPEKCRFLAFDRGYHGDTVGCMSVSGVDLFRGAFAPLLFPVTQVPTPYCYRCPVGAIPGSCGQACVGAIEAALQAGAGELAAIIIEPLLLGAGGMIVYPAAVLRAIANLAQQYGIHLILDEVATGFGRTGTMFACEQAGVRPDFLCLSKGLTSGVLPFAATLTTEPVYEAFLGDAGSGRTFYHGHTFTANPLGCAVALASLDLFDELELLAHVQLLAARLQAGVAQFAHLPGVGETRGIGLVGALEFVSDQAERTPLAPGHPLLAHLYARGLHAGVILRPIGNVLYLFLPHCTRLEELDDILARVEKVVMEGVGV